MNIDRVNQNLASGAYGRRTNRVGDSSGASAGEGARGATQAGDGIQLSDEAKSLGRVESAVRGAPEVREQLVAELHEQVQNGTYRPRDEEVARRIVNGEA